MSDQPPTKDDDEEQPSQPPTKEKIKPDSEPSETLGEEPPSSPIEEEDEQAAQTGRIAILEEREIPFEEERPPNFSPNFKIRIHRIRSGGRSREEKE